MNLEFQNVLDLSYVVDEKSPCELPIDPAKIYDQATLEKDGYFESRIDTSGHYSTHMDAPCLMYPGGATIAEIPKEKLTGNAILMDFSAIKKPNDAVTAEDIKAWIAENGKSQKIVSSLCELEWTDLSIRITSTESGSVSVRMPPNCSLKKA